MEIRLIEHGSDEYENMIDLRMRVLRSPLGLTFSEDDLASEKDDFLIASFDGTRMTGCCVLTKKGESVIQLRQMAVDTSIQTRGIGRDILEFAEMLAAQKGFELMMMHARELAAGFYEKCGYIKKGEKFIEVTIPHFHMEKRLA